MKKKTAYNFWQSMIVPYMGYKNPLSQKLLEKEYKLFETVRKKKYGREKMKVAKKAIREISNIPWIKMVGVTGSVATLWPKKNDDIDLMVICQLNRIWICRIIVTIWLAYKGFKLRNFSKSKNCKNCLCFNLWLDENSLEISKERQNVLVALDLVWLKPVYKKSYYSTFLAKNYWVNKYIDVEIKKLDYKIPNKSFDFWDWLNRFLYEIQYLYMKKKIKGEIVDENRAYFHPQGRRSF